MEELEQEEQGFEVWIKINNENYIVEINSNVFIKDYSGWIKIAEHIMGDKGAHAQSQYLDKPIIKDDGSWQYKYINNQIVEV